MDANCVLCGSGGEVEMTDIELNLLSFDNDIVDYPDVLEDLLNVKVKLPNCIHKQQVIDLIF